MTADVALRQEIAGPGVYPDMPAEQYHGDPAPQKDGGSLSRTGATKLIEPSTPAKFDHWRRHGDDEKRSESVIFGSAAHVHVLTDGEGIVVVDAADWRTNAAKEARDAAIARGQVPILPKHQATVEAMAKALREHRIASRLLGPLVGSPEASAFWRDKRTGRWKRARYDILPRTGLGRRYVIPDYKTTGDASSDAFGKSAFDHGYYLQDPWYCEGVRELGIDPNPVMLFVVQERSAPYLVNVIELDADSRELGRRHAAIATNRFHTCTESGHWPGYGDDVTLSSLPPWALKREAL